MPGLHGSHSIHAAGASSFVWDNMAEPALEVDAGAVVELEAADASGGQLNASGTIGVAPAEPGQHSVLPPRRWGGNMDIKHLRPGTTLLLPVGVEGALFSVGDTHAAMGDGEVCGTAIEATMDIAVRLDVRRDVSLHYPQYQVPAGQETEPSSHHVCTGIGPDLYEAVREATRGMVEPIVARYGVSREEAYAIASVAVDLRIHEIVDAPNWVVAGFLPESIFED